jgi:tetratricopeptide (TPR) repeat protein
MEAVFQQALAHHQAGRLDEAEPLYRQAAAWKPEWTLGNLGILLRTTGRLAEAETVLREALRAAPENAPVRQSLGMTLLQLGQYPEGWRLYEARHEIRPPANPPPLPRWQGEPLAGKRILVVAEQGLGDQILLSRFIAPLAERCAEVVFAAPTALVALFASLPARMVHPESWDAVPADYWTPLGSVPRWLEAGPRDAPTQNLSSLVRAWKPSGTGLMLEGAPTNGNNAYRLPAPAVARAIRGLADFVDLQPQATGAQDFAGTAAIVSGLARVVTVDTAVAHLAGAMGKPCWILMPRPAIDWYANWHDDRTPWHPSVRLLRQRTPGDWAGQIADLAVVLAAPAA